MDLDHRRRWEHRHRTNDAVATPSPFVVRALDHLAATPTPPPSMRALDVACGRGRHSLLLADRGYRVDAVDWALPALTIVKQAAAATQRNVRCVVADVTAWPLPVGHYGLIVVVDFLDRALFPRLLAAVMPGGALLYETHRRDPRIPLVGSHRPEFLLAPGELDDLCRGWRTLLRHEDAHSVDGKLIARAGILAQRSLRSAH